MLISLHWLSEELFWSCPPSTQSSCSPCHSCLPASLTDRSFHRKRVGRKCSQLHHVTLADTHSAATRDPFWRWGKLQDTSVGRGDTQVFVMGSQETRNTVVLNVFHKPSTGTSTPVCSAIISSYFYRLLFFCLNSVMRKISLSSFSSGLLNLHILSVSTHHSSRCPPRPWPC